MKGEPIENGAVAVVGGDVLAVGDFKKITRNFPIRKFEIVELGDGLILPGWVNAHTHLEFSDMEEPLGFPGINFTDWIRRIVKRRIQSNRLESDTNLGASKSL
ncbi:MAG: amidohydrolase family protein, partial [Mariniblastus sp.]